MENLISSCDGKTVLLPVDFSENASLLMQVKSNLHIVTEVKLFCLQCMHG